MRVHYKIHKPMGMGAMVRLFDHVAYELCVDSLPYVFQDSSFDKLDGMHSSDLHCLYAILLFVYVCTLYKNVEVHLDFQFV